MAPVMREQQLAFTLLIIGHNSHDSGISALSTVLKGSHSRQWFNIHLDVCIPYTDNP